ncbi:cytochrome b-c1 complex subunit 8-like [Onychomys torridus]|uniref:cytochrome b-c1 complex subunit 8-like n=1 Tax=Onychomys torridus TaxID=38674 RepID=UPI00167F70C3|nr:cytochrome b-c1 complex subunit 8-like [Onychomys torridus]
MPTAPKDEENTEEQEIKSFDPAKGTIIEAHKLPPEFGKLKRMQHVISYSLSPFEPPTFPNYFSKGIPNVVCMAPPFVVFYLFYTRGNQESEWSKRKNPAMYKNDK